jgi:hypothetical protein
VILPTQSVPDTIVEKLPQVRQWIQQSKEAGLVSIGIIGEAVYVLPGILDSIEVKASILTENVSQQGKSGDVKIVSGWSDADISINLILLDIPKLDISAGTATPDVTRYDCLAEIVGTFKQMKETGEPQTYTIHHPHIKAWGAREFLFSDLKSSESRGKQKITCTLEFDEYDSESAKMQERQLAAVQAEAQQGKRSKGKKPKKGKAEMPTQPLVTDKTRRGLGNLEAQYAAQ